MRKRTSKKALVLGMLAAAVLTYAIPANVYKTNGIASAATSATGTVELGVAASMLSYSQTSITLPLGARLPLALKLQAGEGLRIAYTTGNPAIAKVNEQGVLMPVKAGQTTVTIKGFGTSGVTMLRIPLTVTAYSATGLKAVYAKRSVKAAGATFQVQTVTIPKGMPVTTGLASRKVGAVQSLSAIAAAYQAEVAINGTFFEAYNGAPDPYGNVIVNGMPEHFCSYGTTIGFKWDGSAVMDTLRMKIFGKVESSSGTVSSWYTYFMNRGPVSATTAAFFTPTRGTQLGFKAGIAITVRSGVVTKIAYGENSAIPKDGYVLVFQGNEKFQANRFHLGDKVSYEVTYEDDQGKALDWSMVHTAIGAGPRLVKDGKAAVSPDAEGFKDPKILTGGGARSGIGIRKDGSIVLATVGGATIHQWAQIMLGLGAVQAMNLDGGASSGLYANGKTITTPGRELSNALVFGNKLKW
ncbi:hypothetical protein FHS18_002356 [Paenibacillus phyllosphaerae]|uniref:Phosphodiester glycosidase domain-containing protein n=1 Tax=Paenibacillus phyllosphaerae TaxID=274593 RepID=A0A7W5AXH8_9BACL|nr:phosphodiester glycosidase family protein [Paenibacillus phyllosphaerae]MBB3110289.1 hypothetical protein [Paenibacillus phyllosphaerae]